MVVALPSAAALKDAFVRAMLVGQHYMGQVEELCFAAAEVYLAVEPVRFAKVRVCWVED
jgi:hypothetical protein